MLHIYTVSIKGKKVKFMCEYKLMKEAQLICGALQTTGQHTQWKQIGELALKLMALVTSGKHIYIFWS